MSNKIVTKVLKIVGIIILSIVALFILFIGGMNIFKHFYYKDYYEVSTKVGKIAGLNHGFVPQGLTYYDNYNNGSGGFISAGYMADNSASRIYAVDDKTGEKTYFTMTSNNEPFFGHTGGLQYENGWFYLANESDGLYKFKSSLLDQADSRGSIEIGSPIHMNNHTSFVFSDFNYLYVGEFNNDGKYSCTNSITYNGIKHNAIVCKYDIEGLSAPMAVYSIPNEIQGFCIKEDGTIILSRSYSVTSSNFFIYKPEDIIATGQEYDGAPVYFLGEPSLNITAPAMSEDLDLYNGKIITHFESACNKYYFGKFFFANYIVGLDL